MYLLCYHRDSEFDYNISEYFDSIAQNCSISIAITLEIPKYCAKPSMYIIDEYDWWIINS